MTALQNRIDKNQISANKYIYGGISVRSGSHGLLAPICSFDIVGWGILLWLNGGLIIPGE